MTQLLATAVEVQPSLPEEDGRRSIAFVLPSLGGGGAEIVASRWIEALRDEGRTVHIFTFGGHDVNGAVSSGADHFSRYSRVSRLLLLPLWIRSRVAATGAQCIISSLTFTNLVVLMALRTIRRPRVSVVISERSVLSLATRYTSGGRVKRCLARMLYRRADAVIAISHPVAADLLRYGVAPERVFVVPNPVWIEAPSPRCTPPPAPEIHLVYAGRFVEQKQPGAVVELARSLVERGYQARVTMVGVGYLQEEIADRAAAGGIGIAFFGWTPEWWSVVPDATCLVLPSLVEGFGNVLVEAAAAGIPVVASSQALGVADAIVPGVTGDLAVSSDPEDLADAVVRVAESGNDPKAAALWLSRFTVERSSEILARVLARLDRGVTAA
jgi:glycosyltransferase involved in cell wall biosynthesis